MCGIVGIWQPGEKIDLVRLKKAAGRLTHRGPDDEGFYTSGPLGLGHRRLAIIDLSVAGRQPMSTPDGRYTITFNGEIYNYAELRDKYLADVKLYSTSDTEVLLHLLARFEEKILAELKGMFALALWDNKKQELFLARDPFGKKPLYYARRGHKFYFASETKALLILEPKLRAMDRRALTKYFWYEYVPGPASPWAEIRQLPMGSWAKVSPGVVDVRTWWRPSFEPKVFDDEAKLLAEFDDLLSQAVRRRLVADVPVGVLLSGGIDSTTIAWYMKQQARSGLHSFSVSFGERSFDERQYAQLAARALGTAHHNMTFGLSDFRQLLPDLVREMDVPLADASLLPTYAVSKMAREKVTVVLDGDGSDELLGGYGTFPAAVAAERLPRLSSGVARWLREAVKYLPTSYANFSFDFKVKSFTEGLGYSLPMRNQIWLGSFFADLKDLLVPAWQKRIKFLTEDIEVLVEPARTLSTIDAVSYLTLQHYLHNGILVKLDRATMLASLEARTPFLDVDLAEWLMRMPVRFKKNKYLLRRLMQGRIPQEIIDRKKQGFGIPLGYWLKGPLYDWARAVLAPAKLESEGVLRPKYVLQLLEEHRLGQADHRKRLWTLLAWQLWYDEWVKQR